ncbi:DUF6769 family protein [uncultured Bacteroides sp.]|uniref:DUF6769 family protein n=1 Tax=uncultured Bacteroides sp. TaxID=162156 RepID=UPI002617CFCF|nr:DUF6769 family protein [uncultured Bacteroides sp.]
MKKTTDRHIVIYLFVVICIIMQLAVAFPHHHHADVYCMHPQKTEQASCGNEMHHSDPESGTPCGTDCITRLKFNSSVQTHHLSPDYTFYTLLYTVADAHFGALSASSICKGYPETHADNLYSRYVARDKGLRAPPIS